jgi:endonuclease/exonuclease/phosphatase family metal-dependent hydrolase
MNTIKKIVRNFVLVALTIAGLILIIVAGFLVYSTLIDYKPAAVESITIPESPLSDTIPIGKLELYTWNIGYCGLGSKMDFFYENGKMVRPEKDYYELCREGVLKQITSFHKPDFILLQEIDQQSHRTYMDNQVERVKEEFKDYASFFALNYKVPFVPVPISSPMGKVNAGLITLSHYQAVEAQRYSFPSAYSWPKRLFMLDRGFILTRFNVSNGKHLVLINTHNSAFSDAADMRTKELNMIKSTIQKEYKLGNYVIIGGDWNQNPVPFDKKSIQDGNIVQTISPGIPANFLPAGFQWAFDPNFPTNRDVDIPYTKGKTRTTIIDFFVLSPNIKLLAIHTLQANFEFADHEPVQMEVELK